MTTKAIGRGWQGKQVSSFGNFRRQRKPSNPAIIQTDLQLYYDFGNGLSYDNSSTTIKSVGATSFDGTLTNGPVYSTTYNGICTLDGVNDNITRAASLNAGQNFTVFGWVRMTSAAAVRNCLIANAQNLTNDNGWYFSVGQTGGTGRFFLSIGIDNSYVISSNNVVVANQWQLLGATVSNGGSTIKLYVNGVLQTNSVSSTSSRTISYTQPAFYIGQRDPTNIANNLDYFNGVIGQLGIYTKTFSDSEMLQNFQATRARYGV
tara:strand:- start:344 stop:1129 length:786 start_codon:yes stop_codon:yes gene_type:complete